MNDYNWLDDKIPAEHNRRRVRPGSMQLKESLKGNCICSDHFKCCFLVDLLAELGFKQSKRLLKFDAVPIEEYRGILDACMHARMHARIYIAATAILSLQRTRVFSYLDLHICIRVRKL